MHECDRPPRYPDSSFLMPWRRWIRWDLMRDNVTIPAILKLRPFITRRPGIYDATHGGPLHSRTIRWTLSKRVQHPQTPSVFSYVLNHILLLKLWSLVSETSRLTPKENLIIEIWPEWWNTEIQKLFKISCNRKLFLVHKPGYDTERCAFFDATLFLAFDSIFAHL